MPSSKSLKLIRASAGSGKTFSLAAHYLVLLFSGAGKYREILAVTFTNKATAEMKERILGALIELAGPGIQDSKFKSILKEHYPELSDTEIQLQASSIYRSILHDYSRFSVSTIDGFVQQVIRSFAFELNLDSGYKLEMNQEKVKDELVKALNIQLEKDPGLLEWVTSLAVDRINDGRDWNYQRALKELAGEIFQERYYPFQEAMLAMGSKRGEEFENLKKTVRDGIQEFKAGILKLALKAKQIFDQSGIDAADLDGKSKHPIFTLQKVLDEDFEKITRYVDLPGDFSKWPHKSLENTSNVEALFANIAPVLRELLEFYKQGIKRYQTHLAINKNSSYLRLMQEMADLLKNYRTENRALLISDAQQLLKGITGANPDNPSFIWEKTGNRYKHFLFDEFQDTSSFQWMNFLPLLKNAVAESRGVHTEHLVVGDVKQSIYRWRNGDWRILHSKVNIDTGAHNVEEQHLEFNRRSCANIIRFNNFLYDTIPGILQTHLNAKIDETGRADMQQFWDKEYKRIILESYRGCAQQLTETTLPGGKIEIDLLSKEEESEEGNTALALQYLSEKIKSLLIEGHCNMRDICILVRSNLEAVTVIDHLVNIQPELTAAIGKQFQVLSGEALKIENSTSVQLLISTMNLLAAREDENNIFKTTCARLWSIVGTQNFSSPQSPPQPNHWMRLAREPIERLHDLLPAQLCLEYRAFKQLPLAELTEKLIEVYQLGSAENQSDIPFLLAFRDQVAVFTSSGDPGLPAFLEWWEAEGRNKALPSADKQDAVQVMTVHKSKGLEFKAVLIPFCNWSLNKHSGTFQKKLLWVNATATGFGNFATLPVDYDTSLAKTTFAENYFEEMLLSYMDTLNTLYVATTRAREYLYLISPQKRKGDYHLYDILTQILQPANQYQEEYLLENNQLHYGEFPGNLKTDQEDASNTISIRNYPLNDAISRNFQQVHLPENTWFNDQQRKGTMLHSVLALINKPEEADALLSHFIQSGDIRESERPEFKESLDSVLSNPAIRTWFDTADKVLSERDILAGPGKTGRPDKVFILNNKVVILDFKFGEEQAKYKKQLQEYSNLLLGMGVYTSVEAHIWYAQTKTLQAV